MCHNRLSRAVCPSLTWLLLEPIGHRPAGFGGPSGPSLQRSCSAPVWTLTYNEQFGERGICAAPCHFCSRAKGLRVPNEEGHLLTSKQLAAGDVPRKSASAQRPTRPKPSEESDPVVWALPDGVSGRRSAPHFLLSHRHKSWAKATHLAEVRGQGTKVNARAPVFQFCRPHVTLDLGVTGKQSSCSGCHAIR